MAKEVKALEMLKTNKSVKERAEHYIESIKRNIQTDVIDAIVKRREDLTYQLFDLADFTLETNINSGREAMSREAVEERFKKIIDIEYKLKLIELELSTKQASFDKYFA